MIDLCILIPAAGASSRMRGSDKLLEEIDGESLLHRTARIARAATPSVLVTLPESGPCVPARLAALVGSNARILRIGDAHDGMSASLRAASREIGQAEGLMILLPDMPEIGLEDIERLKAAFAEDPARPVRAATGDGTELGHPVILPRRYMQELAVLTGDRGARHLIEGDDIRIVPLPGRRAVTDLDTPEAWEAWRASRV
ncbi:MAG: nucleotidyltransferase family protein [Rhodobacteraceae bacterium]|nr:nucleotidyltransferase family protein [Paracoccaceae bacterium]